MADAEDDCFFFLSVFSIRALTFFYFHLFSLFFKDLYFFLQNLVQLGSSRLTTYHTNISIAFTVIIQFQTWLPLLQNDRKVHFVFKLGQQLLKCLLCGH